MGENMVSWVNSVPLYTMKFVFQNLDKRFWEVGVEVNLSEWQKQKMRKHVKVVYISKASR